MYIAFTYRSPWVHRSLCARICASFALYVRSPLIRAFKIPLSVCSSFTKMRSSFVQCALSVHSPFLWGSRTFQEPYVTAVWTACCACDWHQNYTLWVDEKFIYKLGTVSKTSSEKDQDSEIFRVIINHIVTQFSRSEVYCKKQSRLEKTKTNAQAFTHIQIPLNNYLNNSSYVRSQKQRLII